MYLVPYIAIAIVFAGALVLCLRSCAFYNINSFAGKAARIATSFLLCLLLYIVFKYVAVETFEAKKWSDEGLVAWIRGASLILFAGANFEIWAGAPARVKR